MTRAFRALVVAACGMGAADLHAQAPDPARRDPATPVEVPVPESPASAAIGATGTVLRPSTAQEFALSLYTAYEQNGKVKPNLAVEVSPYLLFNRGMPIEGYGSAVDIARSQKAGRTKLKSFPLSATWTMANTTISVATGAKDGGDFAKRAAVALKVPLFDEGDPRLNYAFSKCISEIKDPGPVIDPTNPGAVPKSDARKAAEAACVAKANKLHWNRSAAALAFAQTYLDTGTEEKGKLERDARIGWFSYAWGYNRDADADGRTEGAGAGQVIVQLKHQDKALQAATATVPARRYDGTQAYLRWRFGSDTLNFDISASEERRKFDDGKRDKIKIVAAGAEFKWSEFWILLTLGREHSDIGGSKPFVLASFKRAFGREPSIKP